MVEETEAKIAIERVLKNPTYAGLLKVEAFKDYGGGLFDGIHEPIIDKITWMMVQEKMKRPEKTRTVIDDEIPLRGVLKCHCGNPLPGVPSKGGGLSLDQAEKLGGYGINIIFGI